MMKGKTSQLTGVKEIARRAKVSLGTVDRVIHNRSGVSARTKEKINKIIKEIDYQPNLFGRRLANNRVYHFASLIPKVSEETSFWEIPLEGIARAEAEIRQYNVKIEKFFFDQDDKNSFKKRSREILKKKFDGILLAPSFIEESIDFTTRCKTLNIPYVFIDSDIPDQSSLSYIGPDLFKSGYSAANLVSYLIKEDESVAIVNISKEMENYHHLLRKEEGFRSFFEDKNIKNRIEKIDIREVSYKFVKKSISGLLKKHSDLKVLFVTNAKVSIVAHYLQEAKISGVILIGYDFLKENIAYLNSETIGFLICQRPAEQAYQGVITLYNHCVLKLAVEEYNFMPVDIIMKTNSIFYKN